MMTLKQFISGLDTIPVTTSWYLTDISEAKGKQGLYTRQSPQRLKSLKEHALIESAVSSNRIEGVEVEKKRIGTIIFGKSFLHDRSEEEVRGYREALNLIYDTGEKLTLTEDTCKKLHRLTRGEIWEIQGKRQRHHRKTPGWDIQHQVSNRSGRQNFSLHERTD
jgi:hypothetical protein